MKPAGLLLLFPAGLAAAAMAAETSAETSRGRISRETTARILEGLPVFQPPPPKIAGQSDASASQTSDPDVLILPKITVSEKRLPSDADDHLMSRSDFKRKMENLYLDALAEDGPLNVLLNNFTIPIFGSSKAERGRAIYRRRELDRLGRLNDASRSITPDAARKFRQEIDNSHTTRPAGGLRGK